MAATVVLFQPRAIELLTIRGLLTELDRIAEPSLEEGSPPDSPASLVREGKLGTIGQIVNAGCHQTAFADRQKNDLEEEARPITVHLPTKSSGVSQQ